MTAPARQGLAFSKMHGAGNDFVLLDLRGGRAAPDAATLQRMADRHRGIGCDQLITLEDPRSPDAVAAYRIWNSDGSAARQCGNGARCVAAWLRRDGLDADAVRLDSPAGPVEARWLPDGEVEIDMGVPDARPAAIGLALPEATHYTLDTAAGPLRFGAVSMGNPHALIEVADLDATDVPRLGRALQAQPAFTDGVNVGVAQVLAPDRIRLRVYERGAGETLACGSGACAAVAVLSMAGRVGRAVAVELPGGTLAIRWDGPGQPLSMRGPTAFVFEGVWLA